MHIRARSSMEEPAPTYSLICGNDAVGRQPNWEATAAILVMTVRWPVKVCQADTSSGCPVWRMFSAVDSGLIKVRACEMACACSLNEFLNPSRI